MSSRVVPRGLGLAGLRERLEGRTLTAEFLGRRKLGLGDKGKWGKANELLAGLTLNPSPEPDLEDGELKTTVRGIDGRFRESVKICMTGHSPIVKLQHIYLAIARDQNEASDFAARVVRNERVVSLRPTGRTKRALLFDELLLGERPGARDTHFLETRTAGQRGSSTRAFYIRANALERYISDTVVRIEHARLARVLRRVAITDSAIRRAGISLAQKNRVGRFIARTVNASELYAQIRQGPVDGGGEALEDLLVCEEHEDPVQALWRTIYVAVGPPARASAAAAARVVRAVVPLAPTEVVSRALRRDLRLLRSRSRRRRGAAYFLKLKPHGQKGSETRAFYLDRRFVSRYVGLVSDGN